MVQWLRPHLPSNAGGVDLILVWAIKFPHAHASWQKSQNIKPKQYCNKFNEDFKKVIHIKKYFKKTPKKILKNEIPFIFKAHGYNHLCETILRL